MSSSEQQRLDKWLWAARFFKTRALAAEAIQGGKVHLNGQRVKPARSVHVNDELEITRGLEHFVVTVLGLNEQRRPASEARELYLELEASKAKREHEAEQRRLVNHSIQHPQSKPDKRSRRMIRNFTGKG